MGKISFIILTWNSGKVIAPCLESVASIKNMDYEIITVDNGSADDTCQIIAAFASSHPHLTVKPIGLDKNYGTTVSRNIGIRNISNDTDHVCILDSDTVINEDAIRELIRVLDLDMKNAIAGPAMVDLEGEDLISAKKIPTAFIKFCKAFPVKRIQQIGERKEKYEFGNSEDSYPVGYLISACWMIKRKLMDDIGMLDERIFYSPEDVEYCVRTWKKGYRVVYCPKAKIIHATQRISKKKLISRHNWEHIKGLFYFFRKYNLFFSNGQIDCK